MVRMKTRHTAFVVRTTYQYCFYYNNAEPSGYTDTKYPVTGKISSLLCPKRE